MQRRPFQVLARWRVSSGMGCARAVRLRSGSTIKSRRDFPLLSPEPPPSEQVHRHHSGEDQRGRKILKPKSSRTAGQAKRHHHVPVRCDNQIHIVATRAKL